jgi:tRNA(fMet)-specific endonuclease VapC
MSGKYLLDTNIVIALFANDQAVMTALGLADEIFIPGPVIGELYYGAEKSGRTQANLARLEQFITSNTILPCTEITAKQYGRLKNELRQKGRPIPENDLWIAALAVEHNLTLVSRDQHFQHLEGLVLETW